MGISGPDPGSAVSRGVPGPLKGLVSSRHPAWVRGVLAAGVTLFPGGFLAFAVNRPRNSFQEKRNHDFTLIFLIQILYFFNFYIHISLPLY